MSIRHCIAATVLVVIGCLAVNAYQDQTKGTTATTATESIDPTGSTWDPVVKQWELRVKELQLEQSNLESTLENAMLGLELAKRKQKGRPPTPDRVAEEILEKVNRSDIEENRRLWNLVALDKRKPVVENVSSVGRFQFVDQSQDHRGVLIDTTNGHCWLLTGTKWRDIGMPTKPDVRDLAPDAVPTPAGPLPAEVEPRSLPAKKDRRTPLE